MIKLGFSTGALYKTQTAKQSLKIFKELGCVCVELGFVRLDESNQWQLDEITKDDLDGFEHVSFHAPKFEYKNNLESINVLRKIKDFSDNIRKLDLVVFHPDEVEDFSVLKNSGLPIGIENMDNRKNSFKHWTETKKVLDDYPDFGFVLDVNHIYGNDSSMESAKDFYKELGNRISEIHLSGYNGYHEPIFETRQLEILKSIQSLDVPIVVESILTSDTVSVEMDYILKNFK